MTRFYKKSSSKIANCDNTSVASSETIERVIKIYDLTCTFICVYYNYGPAGNICYSLWYKLSEELLAPLQSLVKEG